MAGGGRNDELGRAATHFVDRAADMKHDPEMAKIASMLATEIAARVDGEHGRTEDWLNENFRRQIVDRHARDVIADFLTCCLLAGGRPPEPTQ
jgi:hypothetical protein